MVVNPYAEVVEGNNRIRTFDGSADATELVWHRDRKTRQVTVLESAGWRFQYDNKIPTELNTGDVLHIEKETYHRVIAGNGKLVLEITEYED
jgi:quercetin dioxygenase-like cupin family protein